MGNMNVRTAKQLIAKAEKSGVEIEKFYQSHTMIADELGFMIDVIGCLEDYKKIMLTLIENAELNIN